MNSQEDLSLLKTYLLTKHCFRHPWFVTPRIIMVHIKDLPDLYRDPHLVIDSDMRLMGKRISVFYSRKELVWLRILA